MGTAQIQGELWGQRPLDWSELQEPAFGALYAAAFDAAKVGRGMRLLDVGCGAGLACQIAQARGARVTGLDAAAALVEIAKRRCSGVVDIRVGEIEELPFGDCTFDVVAGFNSFQYAADPVRALAEARRVVVPNGCVVAAVWGAPEQCELAGHLAALGKLMPPPPPNAPGPFALSATGALETIFKRAELRPDQSGSAPVEMRAPDEAAALRGLLAAGPAIRAIRHSGEDAVRKAVAEAITPYRQSDGSYRLQNEFRYLLARR
jgi:SAM-dependent methyltransferase